MSDTLKQIAFVAGLMLIGMSAGILWHAHGGQWWLIPTLTIGTPIFVITVIVAVAFLGRDWSH